jgi:hypothetical protein
MGSTSKGHYAIKTPLGKAIRADFKHLPDYGSPDWVETSFWMIWMSANPSFSAGTHYRLYTDGRFECWHLYEDGTEERLDVQA